MAQPEFFLLTALRTAPWEQSGRQTLQEGQSGNPSGRPKVVQSFVNLAREHTEEAIATLVRLMRHGKSDSVQAQASNMLLDRGWGKPAQMVFQNVDAKRAVRDWSTAELVAFLDDCKRERSEACSIR